MNGDMFRIPKSITWNEVDDHSHTDGTYFNAHFHVQIWKQSMVCCTSMSSFNFKYGIIPVSSWYVVLP